MPLMTLRRLPCGVTCNYIIIIFIINPDLQIKNGRFKSGTFKEKHLNEKKFYTKLVSIY